MIVKNVQVEVKMNNYLENLNDEIKNYFKVLEPEFPEWLNDYINTPELLKQQYISMTCGTIYSNLFESNFFYSSLDHSIGVALIVWHFTHDKKQTLSGLFHDIATPAFKHCVDFLNGDYMNQESTEDLTTQIISNSKEIMSLLERDNIRLEEVNDYHIYPIADNDTPNLSSDRLEYSLSNALFTYKLLDFEIIKKMYNDIKVGKDENNIEELEFTDENLALDFVKVTSKMSIIYREYRTIYSMQLIADILKRLSEDGLIAKSDLYNLKELDIIDIIQKSVYRDVFNKWKKAEKVLISEEKPSGVYVVNLTSKIRYIDPLVNEKRISIINENAGKVIKDNLNYKTDKYVYLENISL